jgi:hypothetical protein
MNNTNTFANLMFKKGSHEVDRIFYDYFGKPQKDWQIHRFSANEISNLMLHAYLCGVKALMTNPSEFLELIKAMEDKFGKI